MTRILKSNEIDAIYDYLHETYNYFEGQLISKTTKGRHKKGTPCGSFYLSSNETISNMISFTISSKKYRMSLAHAIYIYHFKIKPMRIKYLDGNIVNLNIDNLINLSMMDKSQSRIGKGYTIDKRRPKKPYHARIYINNKYKSLGMYHTAEEAHKAYMNAKLGILVHD